MHFSKTYARLLVTLPPELRHHALEYHKLKKLINQTVIELDSLGLGPPVLQSLHERSIPEGSLPHLEERGCSSGPAVDSESTSEGSHRHTIVYEIALNSSALEPRLRLSSSHARSTAQPIYQVNLVVPERSFNRITRALPSVLFKDDTRLLDDVAEHEHFSDFIIPLPSDTAFFQLLTSTLSSLCRHLDTLQDDFHSTLTMLAASISLAARPASTSSPHSFSAYSCTTDTAVSLPPNLRDKSDLYTWREIFSLYAEVEVFESIRESAQGERSIDEAEEQLKLFEELVQEKKTSLILSGSIEALDRFLNLNRFILDVKKFQLANSEAVRKILKKHSKLTTLTIPPYVLERDVSTSTPPCQVTFITRPSKSLPRLLVQAIGEILLPVVPHIDDYSCPICASIAFKPVRLCCSHLFCLRCLVKMQKHRMANCPLCRAPTVLQANSSNVDYGLLNLMADWFPVESREKLRANEREVIQEQLEEFGWSDARTCRIM